jgi:hypothetical protein
MRSVEEGQAIYMENSGMVPKVSISQPMTGIPTHAPAFDPSKNLPLIPPVFSESGLAPFGNFE